MLHEAVARAYRQEAETEDALREALRHAATEAHQRGLRPEELVIALKAVLDDVPNAGRRDELKGWSQTRDRIVSACIAAYFRPE